MGVKEDAQRKFEDAVGHFEGELKKLRTGRPTPEMFENIKVEAYGSQMALSGVASISIIDATLVSIQVWDKSLVTSVAATLQSPDHNYNPQIAGDNIRVPISPMTQDKRIQVVKVAKEAAEKYKIEIRVIRKEFMERLEELKKAGQLPEDDFEAQKKQLQEQVDGANDKIDSMLRDKETSIMKV